MVDAAVKQEAEEVIEAGVATAVEEGEVGAGMGEAEAGEAKVEVHGTFEFLLAFEPAWK